MCKKYFLFFLILVSMVTQHSMAATASLTSHDHILSLFEKEIVPTQADFVITIEATSKIPFLGFPIYGKLVVQDHKIPLKVNARPDLTSEVDLKKGLLMYEFIPEKDYIKKFSWAMRFAHRLTSYSGVSFIASFDSGSGVEHHKDDIRIGERDRLLEQDRSYNSTESFMYKTENSVTFFIVEKTV